MLVAGLIDVMLMVGLTSKPEQSVLAVC